jgi:Flp pilus assembly protein TadG
MSSAPVRSPFLHDESGAGTAWWVLWMIIFMVFGGVAVDSSNAWRMRAELQATADAAAHAGVIDLPNKSAAIASANAMATANMNEAEHGDVLATAEIEIGLWSETTREFLKPTGDGSGSEGATGGSAITDAVRVTTRRDENNANRLKTYFLRLIGMDSWNVSARAVAQRYFPKCANTDGLFARDVVDLQSNNVFKDGICIHGNDHVELNNGNTWQSGVSVTMPNLSDLEIPSSDIDIQNSGLKDALGEEWFDPKIVDQIGGIVASIKSGETTYLPSFVGKDSSGKTIATDDLVVKIAAPQFSAATAEKGYIYHVTCPGNSLMVLGATGLVVSDMIIIADCRIYTGQNAFLKDVIIASTAGDAADNQIYPKAIAGSQRQLRDLWQRQVVRNRRQHSEFGRHRGLWLAGRGR